MIIFLSGNDSYRVLERRQFIEAEYIKNGFEHEFYDCSTPDREVALRDSLRAVGLFSNQKILTLTRPFDAGDTIAKLIVELKLDKSQEQILLLCDHGTDAALKKKSAELLTIINKAGTVREMFEPLEGIALKEWVIAKLKESKVSADSQAISALIQRTGKLIEKPKRMIVSDSWRLSQEIQKLSHYAIASGIQSIDTKIIEQLVPHIVSPDIFALTDSIGQRDMVTLIRVIQHQIDQDAEAQALLPMIGYQLRTLLMIRDCLDRRIQEHSISQQFGLHPYVVQKTAKQAQGFTTGELKGFTIRLAKLDQDIKDGITDPRDGLWSFILDLAKPQIGNTIPKLSIM